MTLSIDVTDFGSVFGSMGGTLETMGRGMIEGFGHCYHEQYNVKMFNDTPIPMHLEIRQSRQFMGAQSEAFEGMLKGLGMSSLDSIGQTISPYKFMSTTPGFNLCFGKVLIDPEGAQKDKTDWGQRGVQAFSGPMLTMVTVAGMSYLWERTCSDHFFCKSVIGTEEKAFQDPNYYHTFSLNGSIGAEFMGPGTFGGPFELTSDFDGVFFNKLDESETLTFIKNGSGYTVTLEPHTFNTLTSDKNVKDSIRSASETRAFVFSGPVNQKVDIPSQGIGDKTYKNPDKPSEKEVEVIAKTTTYEIVANNNSRSVGIQGYNLGNYDQFGVLVNAIAPVKGVGEDALSGEVVARGITEAQVTRPGEPNVYPWRSINPIPCFIWYKSAERAKQDYIKVLKEQGEKTADINPHFVTDVESVWVAYDSGDGPSGLLMARLVPDTVGAFKIMRPTVSKGLSYMYIFSIATEDETEAKKFLQEVLDAPDVLKSVLGVDQTTDMFTAKNAANTDKPRGFYTDKNDVTGCLLYVDGFISYGSGDMAPRFYEITPPLFDAATFAQTLSLLFDESVVFAEDGASVAGKTILTVSMMMQWLKTFHAHRNLFKNVQIGLHNAETQGRLLESLVPDMIQFIKGHGNTELFKEKTTVFSPYGYQALFQTYFIPRGFIKPPLMRMVGSPADTDGMKEGDTFPVSWPKPKA